MFKHYAAEMIQYQRGDKFVEEAEDIITAIYNDIGTHKFRDIKDLGTKTGHIKKLSNLIFERFGLKNEIPTELTVLAPMAVIPHFNLNKTFEGMTGFTFPFMRGFFKAGEKIADIERVKKELSKKQDRKKGYISTKSAKVGGYLSEFIHYFVFDFYATYEWKVTPREVVAIILHEIGHAFTGLEYHYMLENSNATLRQVLVEINKNDIDRAVYIYNNNVVDSRELLDVNKAKDMTRLDLSSKVFFSHFDSIKSQMMDGKYDETTFENLADSFATRFGLGTELAIGLDKIHSYYGKNSPGAKNVIMIMDTIIFMFILSMVVLAVSMGNLLVAGVIIGVFFMGSGFSEENMTYDHLKVRYTRIKNTLINELKGYILTDPKMTKRLLEDILEIDVIVDQTLDYLFINNRVSNLIFPSDRSAKYYYEMQRDLENMSNNTLFVQAGRLSTI